MKAYQLKIIGDVQGVFFRYNAKKMAKKFKISGWIKNSQDGSVEAFVQGDQDDLKRFIEWAHQGSPMASVEKVEIIATEVDSEILGFEIR